MWRLGIFHLSCGEYAILPIDWTTILGIRFEGEPILDEHVSIDEDCTPFSLTQSLPTSWARLFRPTCDPRIRLELDDAALRIFFFFFLYFIDTFFVVDNKSMMRLRLGDISQHPYDGVVLCRLGITLVVTVSRA